MSLHTEGRADSRIVRMISLDGTVVVLRAFSAKMQVANMAAD